MITETEKNPSTRKRANAPAVGSHLAFSNDRMAATTASQTNASITMYSTGVGTLLPALKKTSTVPTQVTASVPPIHTGLVIQYRKLFTAPTKWPKASRVHR